MSRLDEAIKDLEEAAKAAPTGVHFLHLAQAYQKAGRLPEFQKAREKVRLMGLTSAKVDATERPAFDAIMSK